MNGTSVTNGYASGAFYGPKAASMSGGFNFDSGNSRAFGVFKANQQSIAQTTIPLAVPGNVQNGN